MIFLITKSEPTVFLMLTNQDVNDMRNGRTKFVDERMTQGLTFNKVVVSVHKHKAEIDGILKRLGHSSQGLSDPPINTEEEKCEGCLAMVKMGSLLDGKCIACWRELAGHKRPSF
jgi:hypothetical protein